MNRRRGRKGTRQRWLAPEVVQTSAMDCGPAALTCLLEGFGVPASYGRLREACQTDVDGTSIDTLEDIAVSLGLDAEQVMLPVDDILEPAAAALPAIVVVRLPNGFTHFVVAWRRHGPLVQVMDPAVGRRLVSRRRFLTDAYVHTMAVPAATWRAFAGSEGFLSVLRARLGRLGVEDGAGAEAVEVAAADPGWRSLAALDAAARLVASLVGSRALRRRRPAAAVLDAMARSGGQAVPEQFWPVRPGPPSADGEEQVLLRGAVLVRVPGLADGDEGSGPRSVELDAALTEAPARPGRELWRLLRSDGRRRLAALAAGLVLAAAGVVAEALLFRSTFDLARGAGPGSAVLAVLLAVVTALALLDVPVAGGMVSLGRRLEARLRLELAEKVPRLHDRYLQSRPTSDMAERAHSLHRLRLLPPLGGQFLRSAAELVFTAAGIAWLEPRHAPLALASAVVALALPLALQPVLTERDLRLRSHEGALARFSLDALLGLLPVRSHTAEPALRHEHDALLGEWRRAGRSFHGAAALVEAAQLATSYALVGLLLWASAPQLSDPGHALLLVYWSLSLPVLGYDVALLARQYPSLRNVTLRLLEPLATPEDPEAPDDEEPAPAAARPPPTGVEVLFDGISARAGGHLILEGIDLRIEAGSHVALVGASGAGKSSLLGLLLGWHRPSAGTVLVDGEQLRGARLHRLRDQTAWVDPGVQLWNRSLAENLRYGTRDETSPAVGAVVAEAGLGDVVAKLPDGLATTLGEGGTLVSGGEGQRVRLGRALHRSGARLVLLDEPFRGLDRVTRRELLGLARTRWRQATLLCVTHDVGETLAFDRVLVMEGGRVVEHGPPTVLGAQEGSLYRTMLDAEQAVRTELWGSRGWRRLRLTGGQVVELDGGGAR